MPKSRYRWRLMSSSGVRSQSSYVFMPEIEDIAYAAVIALSPEHGLTGGWQPAERLAKHVLQILGVEFTLPQEKS